MAPEDRVIADELKRTHLQAVEAKVIAVDSGVYAPLEDGARERCPRHPSDWPIVASALVLSAVIWTKGGDFLGSGVATWTTDTLQRWLDRQPSRD